MAEGKSGLRTDSCQRLGPLTEDASLACPDQSLDSVPEDLDTPDWRDETPHLAAGTPAGRGSWVFAHASRCMQPRCHHCAAPFTAL